MGFDGLAVEDTVELEAMGIIGSPPGLGTTTTFKPYATDKPYRALRFGNRALVLRFKDAEQVVAWPMTPITKVGQELLPLLQRAPNLVTPDLDYLRALGEGLAKEGVTVEFWQVSRAGDANMFRLETRIWTVTGTP